MTDNLAPDGAPEQDFAQFEADTLGKTGEHAPAIVTEPDTAGENGTGGEEGEAGDGKPNKGNSVQERMNEMTAARREAERVAEERGREVEYWKGMAEGKKPAAEAEKPAEDPEPNPEDYEYGEADSRFMADNARWNARDEFRKQQQQANEQAEAATLRNGHAARVAEAAEKYPDYAEKVQASADRGEWPCTQVMALGIMASDVGPDVAYHLASNHAEAARIAKLHPLEQARELGRIEGGFLSKPKEVAPKVDAPKAPPPPNHQARGAGGKFEIDDNTSDFAAFEAKYQRK